MNKGVVVVGGGLAGLISATALVRKNIPVTLIEKKTFPFHRVCGEYVSEETVPFLESLGLFPGKFQPPRIRNLQLTSVNGKSAVLPLKLGGFGISRFTFDNFLCDELKKYGGKVLENTEVESIHFQNDKFIVRTSQLEITSAVVIGAHGKRSKLDASLHRPFMKKRSPYVGVKYHIRTSHPQDLISLHNFKDGYCGISNIEDGKSNLCYLTHRNNLKSSGDIKSMEEEILFRNPFLKTIFKNSDFLFEKPETINEISFTKKEAVENHVLMCGDSAGMITPLCGNGMAIAIRSAKIVSELVPQFFQDKLSRNQMEKIYSSAWNKNFAMRLWSGRQIQHLFGGEAASNAAVLIAQYCKPLANFLISKTHGKPF